MATYSANTTTKVSAKINAVASCPINATTTVYTVPANSVAIVSVVVTSAAGTGGGTLVVDGRNFQTVTAPVTVGSTPPVLNLYLGPGATVALTVGNTQTTTVVVLGVEYINTP